MKIPLRGKSDATHCRRGGNAPPHFVFIPDFFKQTSQACGIHLWDRSSSTRRIYNFSGLYSNSSVTSPPMRLPSAGISSGSILLPKRNPARQSEPKRETRPTADWPLGLQHSCPPGKNGYLRAKILRKADFSAVARGNKATPDLLPDLISDLESAMDKKKFSLSIPLISCLLLAGRM